jgi:eukaryotic-like serine/threonine-protein kinase
MPVHQGQTLRFGPFSLDPRCGELRTNGTRIKLQGQPIQILELLLEKPGELVSREEIRQKLWSSDTFVDFDHSLNTAIKKLRQALGDEADTPKYIETLPRYGYRFIGEITQEEDRQPEYKWSLHIIKPTILISAALLAVLVLSSFVIYRWLHAQPSVGTRIPVRAQLRLRGADSFPVLSPDGGYLFYYGPDAQIWIRNLQEGTDEPLGGTDGFQIARWSPDGRQIAFFTEHKLKKISLDSRIVTEICDLELGIFSWGASNVILVETVVGLKAVSVETGRIQLHTKESADWLDVYPAFLPDGRHYLFVRIDKNRYYTRGASGVLHVGTLDNRPSRSLDIRVIPSAVTYAAGYLLYNTYRGLVAQAFDASEIRLLGKPTLLIPSAGKAIYFSAAENGILVSRLTYSRYQGETELQLFTRDGNPVNEAFAQGYTDQPRFSPDGKRIAYDQVIGDNRDIWIYDLERHANTRLTPGDSIYLGPVWSPDGKRIAYQYRHAHVRGIGARNSDGSGQADILFETTNEDPLYYGPRCWNPAGDYLFITVMEIPNGPRKIAVLNSNGDRNVRLLPAPRNTSRTNPMISRDGKWLAYYSDDTAGEHKVFVEPYPGAGKSTAVSSTSGSHPQWRADGRELFFLSESKVQVVSISHVGSEIKVGHPAALFSITQPLTDGSDFDPSPDGQLFVVNNRRVPLVPTDTVDLITNWDLLVKK